MIKKEISWDKIDDFDLSCPFCKEKNEKGCGYCIDGKSKVSLRTAWRLFTILEGDYEEKRKEVIKRSNCFLTYNHTDERYYILLRDLSSGGHRKFFCYGDDTCYISRANEEVYISSVYETPIDFIPDLALAFYIWQGDIPLDLAIVVNPEDKGGLSGEDHKIVIKESIKTLGKVKYDLDKTIEKLREYISKI